MGGQVESAAEGQSSRPGHADEGRTGVRAAVDPDVVDVDPPLKLLTDIIRMAPRAATPVAFLPVSVPPPSSNVQVVPPFVVRSIPRRGPPRLLKLLERPMPATRVLKPGSV